MARNCNLRCIIRKETHSFLIQKKKKKLLQKFFYLLRTHVRVVRNYNLDTQNSWKKEFQRCKIESRPIILVICLETLANLYCSLSYVQKIAMVVTEIESLNQEGYTCYMEITLNAGGGRPGSWTCNMILNNDGKYKINWPAY